MSPWRRAKPSGRDDNVLVDYWYSHAVGHVVEALRVCAGYHAADASVRPSLVLNGASPVELASCVPFVERTYPVSYTSFGQPVGSPKAALRAIPRDWDYVLHHHAATDEYHARFPGIRRYYDASRRHFRARVARGTAGQPPPPYARHQRLRLELPTAERERARHALGGRASIAVMPAGSGARYLYPSSTSWNLVLDALEASLAGVVFTFVGRVRAEGGRTASGIARDELDGLLAMRAAAVDAFDRPILEQLAAVEASSLFVSPHTGFGFAATAVGTPWLTLSGGDWHEYFFNGVPFHSVVPMTSEYPVFAQGEAMPMLDADVDGEGPRARVMSSERFRRDLPEICEAAQALVAGRVSYEDALAAYFPRLLDAYGGDRSRIATFEDVHLDHL